MARNFSCGFELNSNSDGVEMTLFSPSGTSISSAVKHSGTYSVRVNPLVSGVKKGARIGGTGAPALDNEHAFIRVYLNVATRPSAANVIIMLRNIIGFGGGGAETLGIKLDSDGTLILFDEDGAIGSPSSALDNDTWYRIELEYDTTGGGGSHIVKGRLDGSEFAEATDRDIAGATRQLFFGANLSSELQTQGDWYFDDIAVNDDTGSFQNSYPGEGEIIHLKPNASGDNSDWSNDYTNVDEVTPDDATTLVASNTSGDIDDYNLEATPAALAATDEINCVQVGVRFRIDDATSTDPNFVVRIKASSSGTVEESVAIDPSTTSWVTSLRFGLSVNASYFEIYDLPGASTDAWTKADLDTAQIGIRETVTDAHFVQVSTIWLLVDYKPVSGTTTSTSSTTTSSSTSSSTSTSSTTTSSSTSSSTSSTTTSSSTSSSTSTTTLIPEDGLAFGEQNPTQGEVPEEWVTWSDGSGGSPTISGDGDWGKINLDITEIGHSLVYYTGVASKTITLTENFYGSGSGTFKSYIRGQDTKFTQDAGAPAWEEYTASINKTWKWIQVKLEGQ